MKAKRTQIVIEPDRRRVLFRPFSPSDEGRFARIIHRVLALPEETAKQELARVWAEFGGRHQKLREFLLRRYEQVAHHVRLNGDPGQERKELVGAYFTQEYALESAALFNPSIVWHPDQSNLPAGSRRFILSLRATGEGHISSLTFRSGTIDAGGRIVIDPPTGFVTAPDIEPNPVFEKHLFKQKLHELALNNPFSAMILDGLGDRFSFNELEARIERATADVQSEAIQGAVRVLRALAQANYEVRFAPEQDLSERIIFPYTPAERNGIEDARFVAFRDGEDVIYYATYTAFDGQVILPQLLETRDFLHFKVHTLSGPGARNKNLALFPRKIDGRYAMLSRQDNENIYIMFSDRIHHWESERLLLEPEEPWEFVQIGSCSPPIEIEAGWLVLCHGVGPMRKYCLSACLLDRRDPTKVLGRLREPLLAAEENEREGYVPNVVYTCGALLHNRTLVIPYAMADYATSFATADLDALLRELRPK